MIRFLHTSDWQLGMSRHFFSEGAQERFAQARLDVLAAIGKNARDLDCVFVVAAGDCFDSNLVERKVLNRTLDVLREAAVPFYLLPGNHDSLCPGSIYRSPLFLAGKPENVTVLDRPGIIEIQPGIELAAAPWMSHRPNSNPLYDLFTQLEPTIPGRLRIVVGHGGMDLFSPGEEGGMLEAARLETFVEAGKAQYLALGDRHSPTPIGASGRICYSGSPEATDFPEEGPGSVLVVELTPSDCVVERLPVGQWRFIEIERDRLTTREEAEALLEQIKAFLQRSSIVLRLRLAGALPLSTYKTLKSGLDLAGDSFAALDLRDDFLAAYPEDGDFAFAGLSGFAAATAQALNLALKSALEKGESRQAREEGRTARNALMLLASLAEDKQ